MNATTVAVDHAKSVFQLAMAELICGTAKLLIEEIRLLEPRIGQLERKMNRQAFAMPA